jgi:amino acid transporter
MAMRAEQPAPQSGGQGSLPTALVLGFAIASIGGPLALLTLLPDTAGDAIGSAGLIVILSLAVFAIPLGIWLAFSSTIASGGGLTAFVEAAVGRRAAVAHGWLWAFAYFLYLPYTVTFVVYDLLPPVFPGISAYRSSLELVVPVVIVAIMLVPLRAMLVGLGLLAAAQLVLMVVLAIIEFSHAGVHLTAHPELGDTSKATGNTALLFICASLPLYLGAEVRGGSRTMRRVLLAAVAVVGAAFLATAIPLAGVPDELRDAAVPGAAIAQAYSGRGLAVIIGLFTAASTLALIIAEYVALARLIHWLHGPPVKSLLRWIAVPFIAADAISLIDPDRFYDDLLKPSLGALFISQIVVFAAFPRYRRGSVAIGAAAAASALAVWGLYTLFAGGASS